MSTPMILDLSRNTPNIDDILVQITHIHASCIEYDHTQATFLPPLSNSTMLEWWHARLDEVTLRSRKVWVELQPNSSRKANLASPLSSTGSSAQLDSGAMVDGSGSKLEVAGVVCLDTPQSQTGPFRGMVEKLLVSPNHRQKGVAKRLMAELERVALDMDRWMLMLDTEVGSPAELIYPKLGYVRVGVVPGWGYCPPSGEMSDEVWFYKNLRERTV